ncbi:hypothetical protein LguiB_027363 [Lonicera macranthoides]
MYTIADPHRVRLADPHRVRLVNLLTDAGQPIISPSPSLLSPLTIQSPPPDSSPSPSIISLADSDLSQIPPALKCSRSSTHSNHFRLGTLRFSSKYNNWFTFIKYEEPVTVRSCMPIHARELATKDWRKVGIVIPVKNPVDLAGHSGSPLSRTQSNVSEMSPIGDPTEDKGAKAGAGSATLSMQGIRGTEQRHGAIGKCYAQAYACVHADAETGAWPCACRYRDGGIGVRMMMQRYGHGCALGDVEMGAWRKHDKVEVCAALPKKKVCAAERGPQSSWTMMRMVVRWSVDQRKERPEGSTL